MARDEAPRAVVRRAAWAWLLILACAPAADENPPRLQRLLAANSPATLGAETRLATGSAPEILFYGDFETGSAVPRYVGIPDTLAGSSRVVLTRRVWRGIGNSRASDSAVRTGSVEIDHSVQPTRAPLGALGTVGIESPISVQIIGVPADPPITTSAARVRIPDGAVLDFGFGVREEAWGPEADAVRFDVSIATASSEPQPLFARTLDPGMKADQRWFDERVDLAAYAGQEVTLDFRTTRLGAPAGYSLPVWSDPVIVATRRDDIHSNVVLISVDTLRARSLGTYGYGRDTSPFLDSLARAGSLFEQALTASVTTSPAHMSLFTGLYPVNHGIRRGLDRKRPQVTTLAAHLRGAGYRTAAFTENGYLVRRRGFGEGFDEYTENLGHSTSAPGQAPLTFGQARSWIERHRALPFFLFVHTYEVHSPYDPEAPYAALYDDDGAPGPADAAVRAQRDQYDREIRSLDDELLGLFATLEEHDLAESTLVVIVSDHGEEFSEHGGFQHGGAVFEESLHVPLLFFGPGRIPEGRRYDAPVSLTDVTPTILDLLGIAVPEFVDGISLKGVLLAGETPPQRPLFAEAQATERWTGLLKREPWNPPLFAVRLGTEKFIVHRPSHGSVMPMRRFDLAADPAEQTPLPVNPTRAREIDELIARHLRGAENRSQPDADDDPGVSPDLLRRLRALGYAE